ncbi:MAG: elongation factor P--(R)-beta-lysine ligase [Aquificae bacterium]|nr:elongation factor P--(R)-beta-lysine ligase [Aquificota bacterium]
MDQLREVEEFLDRVRSFFKGRGYAEVITPYLLPYPNLDDNVYPIVCEASVPGLGRRRLFLHTSPEYPMKKLLARFGRSIFQICHAFRDREGGRLHDLEFLMLEYYKVGEDYRYLMEELSLLLKELFGPFVRYGGREVPAEPLMLRLEEAFKRYLGFVPDLSSEKALKKGLEAAGIHFEPEEDLETLFWRAYVELEKHLGFEGPTFVYDFPEPFGALARCRGGVCERFELYLFGLELANGYTEVNDPFEVRRRLERVSRKLNLPLDEEFVRIHEKLPPLYAGVSVGLDRLLLLKLGLKSIHELYYRRL